MNLAIGQVWEIYSEKTRRWARATLVEITEHGERFKYHELPEFCDVEKGLVMTKPAKFRFIAETKKDSESN